MLELVLTIQLQRYSPQPSRNIKSKRMSGMTTLCSSLMVQPVIAVFLKCSISYADPVSQDIEPSDAWNLTKSPYICSKSWETRTETRHLFWRILRIFVHPPNRKPCANDIRSLHIKATSPGRHISPRRWWYRRFPELNKTFRRCWGTIFATLIASDSA